MEKNATAIVTAIVILGIVLAIPLIVLFQFIL